MRMWTWAKRWFWMAVPTGVTAIWIPDAGYDLAGRTAGMAGVFLVVSIVLAVASDGEDQADVVQREVLKRLAHEDQMRRLGYDVHGYEVGDGHYH